MKYLAILCLSILSTTAFATGNIDASEMKFKIYKFAVSGSAACTNPISIFTSATGSEQDMLSGPTFGSGHLASGTYPCVMIELSKIIKTAAAATSGSCTSGLEFSDVICQDGVQSSQLIDGTSVSCSGGTGNDQHVTLFITTISAGSSGNRSLLPPTSATDTTSGLRLTSPFVVSASVSGTFAVNFHNFLSSGGGLCNTSAPTFSFQ